MEGFPSPGYTRSRRGYKLAKFYSLNVSQIQVSGFFSSFSLSQKDQGGVGRRNMSSVRHRDKNSASFSGALGVWGIKTAEKELSPHFLLFS